MSLPAPVAVVFLWALLSSAKPDVLRASGLGLRV